MHWTKYLGTTSSLLCLSAATPIAKEAKAPGVDLDFNSGNWNNNQRRGVDLDFNSGNWNNNQRRGVDLDFNSGNWNNNQRRADHPHVDMDYSTASSWAPPAKDEFKI